jgi:hypothetical protein
MTTLLALASFSLKAAKSELGLDDDDDCIVDNTDDSSRDGGRSNDRIKI